MLTISKQFVIVLSVLTLLMGVSEVNAGNCKHCSGYSDWSGNGPSDPPECDEVDETRILGSCIQGGSGNCVETSMTTTRTLIYEPFLPLMDQIGCDIEAISCFTGCLYLGFPESYCSSICGQAVKDCYDEHMICVEIGDVSSNFQMGCQ